MMRALLISTVLLALGATTPEASAQQDEKLTLSKVLYFDCTVAADREPTKTYDLDVSYLMYAGEAAPQVNFRDPSKLTGGELGWAPKGHFALSRQVSDRELYVWRGRQLEGASPVIDSVYELTPNSDAPSQSKLAMTRFGDGSAGAITVQKYSGPCTTISGKAAWDRYQNGEPK